VHLTFAGLANLADFRPPTDEVTVFAGGRRFLAVASGETSGA
jgi:hypothetical protein